MSDCDPRELAEQIKSMQQKADQLNAEYTAMLDAANTLWELIHKQIVRWPDNVALVMQAFALMNVAAPSVKPEAPEKTLDQLPDDARRPRIVPHP
jgi:hypothetical protein